MGNSEGRLRAEAWETEARIDEEAAPPPTCRCIYVYDTRTKRWLAARDTFAEAEDRAEESGVHRRP